MNKQELITYLDEYLKVSDFIENSKNGLQVDTQKTEIQKIGYAVDATTYIFEKAKQEWVDMVISHHGIYWWDEQTLTDISYERINTLIKHDICLYASHIPLDAHPQVGNNIWLIKAFVNIFGLREWDYEIESFSSYNGKNIGFGIKFKNKLHVSNLITPYAERMWLLKKFYNFWNKQYFTSLWIITWGAGKYFIDAKNNKYDIFLTGEASHGQLISAKEHAQSIMLGGHYETEKIGPKLLAYHLKETFWIEIVFLDEKY